jgi:arylsulfatase A-like enzyme
LTEKDSRPPKPMNAIVVSFGGVHANTLGCYGGEQIETAALDQFAAEALVFDQCFVECPCPTVTRRNWWTGCLQYYGSAKEQPDRRKSPTLIATLRAQGVQTAIIRDTSHIIPRSELDPVGFDQVHEIELDNEGAASDLMDSAAIWLGEHSDREPFFLFLDCHGAHGQAGDEYLAALQAIDEQAGQFFDELPGLIPQQTLLMITSDAGRVAVDADGTAANQLALTEAQIHIPLLVRYPGMKRIGRSSALVQSIDLVPTVLEAIGIATPDSIDGQSLLPICSLQVGRIRDVIRLAGPHGECAIRTPEWYMTRTHAAQVGGDSTDSRLFVKPYDRWERDDVAKQYPDVVSELIRRLQGQI